jgi:hypothetical protein
MRTSRSESQSDVLPLDLNHHKRVNVSRNRTLKNASYTFTLAQGERIELPSLGLESKVMPLYDPCMKLFLLIYPLCCYAKPLV